MFSSYAREVEETWFPVLYAIKGPLYNLVRLKSDRTSVEGLGVTTHLLRLEQVEPFLQGYLMFPFEHSPEHEE